MRRPRKKEKNPITELTLRQIISLCRGRRRVGWPPAFSSDKARRAAYRQDKKFIHSLQGKTIPKSGDIVLDGRFAGKIYFRNFPAVVLEQKNGGSAFDRHRRRMQLRGQRRQAARRQ
jgi:hypothetical protein